MVTHNFNKILVVDDTAFTRNITVTHLLDLGIPSSSISQAVNGKEGWHELKQAHKIGKPYTLVLSDWNMPTMNGLEFLKKVRADETFQYIPFILVTTESEKEKIIEAVTHKVTNYIIKPVTMASLEEKIIDYI